MELKFTNCLANSPTIAPPFQFATLMSLLAFLKKLFEAVFPMLFCLLYQAAILDVLGRIVPPMYAVLYIHTLGLILQCTLPLSKYHTLPIKISSHNHSILSCIQFKIVARGDEQKKVSFLLLVFIACGKNTLPALLTPKLVSWSEHKLL